MNAVSTVRDSLFGGQVVLWQPERGYRANVDALLLSAFAARSVRPPGARRRLLDLGAGVGSVTLCLHQLAGVGSAVLLEREPLLAELARRNLDEAGLRGEILIVDLEQAALPPALERSADVVVANPPYFPPGAVRPAENALLKGGRTGPLLPFVRAAARALAPRGRASFVYPAASLQALLRSAEEAGLAAKRLRFVHAYGASPARVVLAELRQGRSGGLTVEPPVVEWSEPGVRSPELAELIAGRAGDRRGSPPPPAR